MFHIHDTGEVIKLQNKDSGVR